MEDAPVVNHASEERRRPRVLLSAAACCPGRGSEPGVGWHRALQIARRCDTWVLCTEGPQGAEIRRYLEKHGPIAGLHFVYVPKSSLMQTLSKIPGMYYLAYNLWQRRALGVARRLHEQWHFDLAHQVTFCGYREPGYLWKLGIPFIWGPVGGTQNYPWRFLRLAGFGGAVREGLRNVVNALQLRFSPRVRSAVRHATVLLAANTTVQQDLTRVHGVKPLVQLETGLARVATTIRRDPPEDRPLRILWAGELQPWKALSLLLMALARLPPDVPYAVRILGRGSLQGRWQRQARRLGVEGQLQWLGWLPHAEALQQYAWADVFAFTSLRDTSGNVVLEALAAGTPVICLDHQGVRDMVTPQCGVKIPVTNPQEVAAGLSKALIYLAKDWEARTRLGRGAVERAKDFLWSRQGERMLAVYRQVLPEWAGDEGVVRSGQGVVGSRQ